LFGADALYIPYTDPGYILFKEVEAKVKDFRVKKGFDPKVILLQNHGIFVSADTTQEVIDIYDEIITNIEKAVKTPSMKRFACCSESCCPSGSGHSCHRFD
jgi:rhamnose utilization protein RhaD (predicted bifunctional aldolase and dehydrogenase)